MVAAGSLLGTLLSEPMSYPVGKVNLLDVYPMDFEEFLGAVKITKWIFFCRMKCV